MYRIGLILVLVWLMSCGSSPKLEVSISVPSLDAFTNGQQTVQVNVAGGTPDSLVLLKNGQPLATLTPPYTYAWDTRSEPEAEYTLVARAITGGSAFESEGRKVVVDRTSPTITSQTPKPNAQNILYSAPITVEFSEPILPSSISSGNVQLNSVGTTTDPVASTLKLSDDGRTLSVQAQKGAAVQFPANLQLSLNNLKDRAGNPLAANTWSWNEPAWWTNNVAITDVSFVLDFKLDEAGRAVVAYQAINAGRRDILVKRWNGTQWDLLGNGFTNDQLQSAYAPSLAIDKTGNIYIAWTDFSRVYVYRWNGNAWEVVGLPFSSGANSIPYNLLSLAIDGSSRPVVAWYEKSGNYYLAYLRHWNGTAWVGYGNNLALNVHPATNASQVKVRVDPQGRPLVGWLETDPAQNTTAVYVKRLNGTALELLGGGESAVDEMIGSGRVLEFDLATDATGTPFTSATRLGDNFSSGRYAPLTRLESYGWRWFAVSPLFPYPANIPPSPQQPSLSFDSKGNAVLSWINASSSPYQLYLKRYNATASSWIDFAQPLPTPYWSQLHSSPPILTSDDLAYKVTTIYDSQLGGRTLLFVTNH